MQHRTLTPLLGDALDTLLSLKTSPSRHAIAFSQVEAVVAPLALDPHQHLVNAFLASQDSLERNLTSGLLEWLGRTLVRFDTFKGSDADKVRDNMSRCLGLIQGLLLLHRPSQRLFARKASLEYLVAVVELTRPTSAAATTTPIATLNSSPHPSPVLFPTSPAFHHSVDPFRSAQLEAMASTAAQNLAICALDTLLCALVDRPKNLRAFEESGGLESIVKVLKDRNVAQPVRIKIIEILYYYLLPETSLGPSAATTPSSTYSAGSFASSSETTSTLSSAAFTHSQLPIMLASAATEFVPQTPVKPKPTPSIHRSNSLTDHAKERSERRTTYSASSRDPSPTRTPQRPRGLRHKRSQSLLAFPTQPSAALSTSPRTLSQSVSAPTSDSESTPRQRFIRSSRNPLEPIPASPDLARPRISSHRRTQSTSAASLVVHGTTHESTPIRSSKPPPRTPGSSSRKVQPGRGEETAMLPPPVPLSRSTSTRLPPPSHRRTTSSTSSASSSSSAIPSSSVHLHRTPLARSSSLSSSTPRTSLPPPQVQALPPSIFPPRPALSRHNDSPSTASTSLAPPASPTLSTHSSSSSSRGLSPSSHHHRGRSDHDPERRTTRRHGPGPGQEYYGQGRSHHYVRSEVEKKELLRQLMPNVDALEQRFKMMGLSSGIGEPK